MAGTGRIDSGCRGGLLSSPISQTTASGHAIASFWLKLAPGVWRKCISAKPNSLGLVRPEKDSPAVPEVVARRLPGVESVGVLERDGSVAHSRGRCEGHGCCLDRCCRLVLSLLLLFTIGALVFWRTRHSAGGLLFTGNDHGKIYDQSNASKVTFDDVAGVDESKAELVEIVDFLKNPQKYQQLGGRIPKGVLLVGPPGTGKTLLAKAVAGEAAVSFFSISASEFIEMFVGVGAARVRHLFERAKRKAPCIVFIDELDAIGKSRSDRRHSGSHDEREQTLEPVARGDGWVRPDQGHHCHCRDEHSGGIGPSPGPHRPF